MHVMLQPLADARAPFKEGEAPKAPFLPSLIEEGIEAKKQQLQNPNLYSQSQPSDEVDRNREYKIRRAALGDNPTQDEMDAVVAYGLQQHRINFPHLYGKKHIF